MLSNLAQTISFEDSLSFAKFISAAVTASATLFAIFILF